MNIKKFDQRSPEWLAWRNSGIGASETAQILNVSPFGSAQKLWEIKTGRRAPDQMNPAMLKGQQDEPEALREYENVTGILMDQPSAEHDTMPFIRASFDGINVDLKRGVEIKCPGAKTHQLAIDGDIPEYYLVQMHQQMLVGDLYEMDYFSYRKEWDDPSKRGVLITVKRSEILINRIIEECTTFWEAVQNDTPIYSDGWEAAANHWININEELTALQEVEQSAKDKLIALAEGKSMQGSGVSLTVSEKVGAIDWKAFIADKGFSESDAQGYRKPSSVSSTVRRMKSSPRVEVKEEASTETNTLIIEGASNEGESWSF